MGSCPSVTSAPDVAELSRMSVLGCAWGIGVGVAAGGAGPVLSMPLAFSSADFCSADLWSAAFCSAVFWTVDFVSALEFFWSDAAGWAGLVGLVDGAVRLVRRLWLFGQRRLPRSRSDRRLRWRRVRHRRLRHARARLRRGRVFLRPAAKAKYHNQKKERHFRGTMHTVQGTPNAWLLNDKALTIRWMQRAATQMAGNLKSALAQPERGFCHPTDKQSYCPAALGVKVTLWK